MPRSTRKQRAARLRELHDGTTPLVLANAWDAASAPVFARLGVRRVSIGSAPMRAPLGLGRAVAEELLQRGTYQLIARWAVPYPEMQILSDT